MILASKSRSCFDDDALVERSLLWPGSYSFNPFIVQLRPKDLHCMSGKISFRAVAGRAETALASVERIDRDRFSFPADGHMIELC